MIDLEYKICSSMIFYILFLKHTICHRFRIQKDMFHILLPKQISSLGTVSGRFWGPRGEKIIEENIGSVQNLRRLLGIRWQAQFKTYEENH